VREVLLASTKEPLFPRQAVKVILHNNPSSSHQFDVNPEDNLHRPTLAQIQKEIELWQTLPIHHPNILPLLDSFSTRDASFLHMHYCPGGSLFDVVRRHREKDRGRGRRLMSSSFQRDDDLEQGGGAVGLPEAEARKLFKGVADGLKALHDMGVVHGDLKAENVLIDADVRLSVLHADLFLSRAT
jgi:serine/threonine protein kinase